MFNIDEVKYLCVSSPCDFYLSPESSYEFLIYGDIDHFEIIVPIGLKEWLSHQRHIEYTFGVDYADVVFLKEDFVVRVYSLNGLTIEAYLNQFDFSFQGIAVKISHVVEKLAFACYKEKCYATWIDPFDVKDVIKSGYIKPLHMNEIASNGHKLFEMIVYMIVYHFDIEESIICELKNKVYHVPVDICDCFFSIINYSKSYRYILLLHEIGVLEKAYPIIHSMIEDGTWLKGIEDLRIFENMMTNPFYFSDSVYRHINRTLSVEFDNGLSKYQMLKFSLLFKEAYKVMHLKRNAPERYETSFTNFCDYFGFDEVSCRYFSQIIKSRNEILIDLYSNKISIEKQYDFYDEFQNQTIEILLINYISQIKSEDEKEIKLYVEELIKGYVSKYLEIQSVSHEITTLDIQRHSLSDVTLTLLIEDVKKRIFYGNLRYDRRSIIDYLQKLIEQS